MSKALTERQQLKLLLEETDPEKPTEVTDGDPGSETKKKRKRKPQGYEVETIVGMKVDAKTVQQQHLLWY